MAYAASGSVPKPSRREASEPVGPTRESARLPLRGGKLRRQSRLPVAWQAAPPASQAPPQPPRPASGQCPAPADARRHQQQAAQTTAKQKDPPAAKSGLQSLQDARSSNIGSRCKRVRRLRYESDKSLAQIIFSSWVSAHGIIKMCPPIRPVGLEHCCPQRPQVQVPHLFSTYRLVALRGTKQRIGGYRDHRC
jgi:hypothetical protein